jgi:phosphatidylserine/phosphatidylglycerophosphate/cardiolipin synthase-like enzyme
MSFWLLPAAAIVALVAYGLWHARLKPLPAGLSLRGEVHWVDAGRVAFRRDLTAVDDAGAIRRERGIFPALFDLVDHAEHYILLDFFLFNDYRGRQAGVIERPLAAELADRLLARREAVPGLVIDVVTDPINSAYNGARAPALERLREAGVNVIVTNLDRLRDSNPFYSVCWRLLLRWLPQGWFRLPHPFAAGGERVGLASWLRLINFKANHRKVAVVDRNGGWIGLVTSANPHGASSSHSNVALLVADDGFAGDLHRREAVVARFSGGRLRPLPKLPKLPEMREMPNMPETSPTATLPQGSGRLATAGTGPKLAVRLLTERCIREVVVADLEAAGAGDEVTLAMFYLADRAVVRALLAAARRGAQVRLILDPNRDAFGYVKNGVPNRPVAAELRRKSNGRIAVRWYNTHGEQFHTKLLFVRHTGGIAVANLGSANFTRRNIGGWNLETNIHLAGPAAAPPLVAVADYLDILWENRGGRRCTLPAAAFADDSRLKYLQYRLQEMLGLGTF